MGTYVTEANVLDLMPQLPRTATAGYTKTSAVISHAINIADSEIDGCVAKRYSTPFTTIPVQLRTIAKELAVYHTYMNLYPGDNINRNAFVERFDDNKDFNAYARLQKICEGEMKLTLTNGSLVGQASTLSRATSARKEFTPIFDVDSVTSWRVDPDLVDNIADNR